jgi:phenylacetate-coenzyme A ligase PaaK-like adenylate-forming protein
LCVKSQSPQRGTRQFTQLSIYDLPLEKVTEFHQTSGTSGQPVYQPDT